MSRKINLIKKLAFLPLAFLLCSCSRAPQSAQDISVQNVMEASPRTDTESIKITGVNNDIEATQNATQLAIYNTYDVNLEVNPETRIINGVQKIKFTNKTGKNLDKIYLNVYLNAFSSDYGLTPYFSNFYNKIYKNGLSYGYTKVINASCDNEDAGFVLNGTVLELTPQNIIKTNDAAEIKIQFESFVPKINHRTGANDKAMWFGNFLPTLAVYDKEGWHTEPYYPAGEPFYTETSSYIVNIKTPANYTVVATGLETTTEIENKTEKTTTITAKLARDFAFAISDSYVKDTVTTESGIDINLYSYTNIPNKNEILRIAEESLNFFSDKIATYPFMQLDIVECELFFEGGMEYPEIIFMDSKKLKNKNVYSTIAHEIGHQWFYNIIGNNQIKNAWLDEATTMFIQEGIFLDDKKIEQKIVAEYENLKTKLKQNSEDIMSNSIDKYSSWEDYYNIQYLKGKLMMYSLKCKMGEETFDRFLKDYYTKYAFRVVGRSDFIEAAEEAYGDKLTEFFNNWLYGVGIPELR